VWAMTGAAPNPLAEMSDERMCVDVDNTATVQEVHLVALHLVCEALDEALDEATPALSAPPAPRVALQAVSR
jgi:D-sedoheptulose 7-phosphate isomerase